MNIREKIASEAQHLPESHLKQVLEFIRLLQTGISTGEAEMTGSLKSAQSESLLHLENEFKDYRKQFPRE